MVAKKKRKKSKRLSSLTKEQENHFRNLAREQYQEEGRLEVDDGAKVSWVSSEEGGSSGAYVEAWVWVDA